MQFAVLITQITGQQAGVTQVVLDPAPHPFAVVAQAVAIDDVDPMATLVRQGCDRDVVGVGGFDGQATVLGQGP
ncbi:hypothetical protein D9M68_681970 [compost metagenome]